jgi:RNA polymerase sigma factor (sigma-70 family)
MSDEHLRTLRTLRVIARKHAASPESEMIEAERALALRRALEILPPKERLLVDEHYFGGMSLTDASQRLGLSKSWGSRILSRALRRLHRELIAA